MFLTKDVFKGIMNFTQLITVTAFKKESKPLTHHYT